MQHLLGISSLSDNDINEILDLADTYASKLSDHAFEKHVLRSMRILSLFFEDSTRTRISFEMAARRLGAEWINIDIARSSVTKGESLRDTVLTLCEITRPDAIIVRHSERGAPEEISSYCECTVINAGDNANQHPTQALLDALTIKRHKKSHEGLNIAICGDVAHSRVANSNIELLTRLGANVRVIAPDGFMPQTLPPEIEGFNSLEDGLSGCDIVMMLRIQKERLAQGQMPDPASYFQQYGLTPERLTLAKDDALVMHPGPMNRGVEIDSAVADSTQSVILEQVANGMATRMAVMEYLLQA